MKDEIKVMKITDLVLDRSIYPRNDVYWALAYQYSEAMLNGSVFPPILVGFYDNKYFVLDGWHRLEATGKLLKKDKIKCKIRIYANTADMYKDAVKANAAHGQRYSAQELGKIVLKLEELKIPKSEIAQLTGIREIKIDGFKAARIGISSTTGQEVVLKKTVNEYAGRSIPMSVEQSQMDYMGSSQHQILNEMISLVQNDSLDMNKPDILIQAVRLLTLLEQKISKPMRKQAVKLEKAKLKIKSKT